MFVARQPIFDRKRELYAYELLFRSDDLHNEFDNTESGSATTQVIANSLLSIGLDNVLCGRKAFLNFDHGLLLSGLQFLLPPEMIVLEILESVEPTDALIATCRDLQQLGYAIGLDDFAGHPSFEPLTQIASVIKVDMRVTSKPEQERLLRSYQPRGIAMVAEKVETYAEFDWAMQAGFDYFQGYFFARPSVIRGRQIPAGKINCLRLLREIQPVELDFDLLRTIIREDVSLSYKLLRYVNSALFCRYEETRSISHALARLGEEAIRHWAVLAALPIMAKDKPGELVTHSLVRASFCERLVKLAVRSEPSLGFLMGLFSLLDALIDVPLQEALRQAGVGPAISGALLDASEGDEALRCVYKLVREYETGHWRDASASAANLGINAAALATAYSESTLWAQQALHATARKANSRRSARHNIQGTFNILWEDGAGHEKVSVAHLVNISVDGMQLQLSERIPVHTSVSCNDAKLGISGRGSVRYCNSSKGKYLIGLEFCNGTGWREPS